MKEVLIFVYGTLKSKQCRSRIMDGCQFVGEAKTKRDYKLVNLGSFPGLVPAKNGDNVAGELYVVDENKLRQLDMIEGSMYKFEKIELEEVKLKEKPLSEAANGQLEEMKLT